MVDNSARVLYSKCLRELIQNSHASTILKLITKQDWRLAREWCCYVSSKNIISMVECIFFYKLQNTRVALYLT